MRDRPLSLLALIGFLLAVLAALAAALSGFGTKWQWWHFRTGFTILRWAAYTGLLSAALSVIGCVVTRPKSRRSGLAVSVTALLISLAVVGVPLYWLKTAQRVPPIHDITTDAETPPSFVAILALRKDAPNPAGYGGPETAAQQHTAYPDIAPAMLPVPPDKAFERALSAARKSGWEIVAADSAGGRIEATDTTFWYGFKDDIVIRITAMDKGSRIDVRSVSRVGKSDVGTNAKRIRMYLRELKGSGK